MRYLIQSKQQKQLFFQKEKGLTLIELIIFIVITALVAVSVFAGLNAAITLSPTAKAQTVAAQAASRCMEWYLGQRYMNGFTAITCPSTTIPSFCSVPSGYSITSNVACTTIGSDPNYKTITVTVTGQASASLSLLIADY